MKNELIAAGRVESLCINGKSVQTLQFDLDGPQGDMHAGFSRKLSGHDGAYLRTSELTKGSHVFNWRTWTALSSEEMAEVEKELEVAIPPGCLLENIVISGIRGFSKLLPTSRLVFPRKRNQTVLAVWEENSPCHVVGERLEDHYSQPGLKTRLIAAAQDRRGVMGFVLSPGVVQIGDEVRIYPPAE